MNDVHTLTSRGAHSERDHVAGKRIPLGYHSIDAAVALTHCLNYELLAGEIGAIASVDSTLVCLPIAIY